MSTRSDPTSSQTSSLKPFGWLETYSNACPWAVFPRKKLDTSYRSIFHGLHACLAIDDDARTHYEQAVATLWNNPNAKTLICLSVRTAFDLYLQVQAWPRGSEILCSAITIPDMLKVMEFHGLVPVPVDLDLTTCAVQEHLLSALITPNTKAIIIAHVFGTINDISSIIALAQKHQLLVIEDCAQAYNGKYKGHAETDVSMFSFGTIKTSTAFGGAVVTIRDPALAQAMTERNARYDARPRSFFAQRLIKYAIVHGITTPSIFGLILRTCQRLGINHDQVITAAIRGFSGPNLISLIRHRPSVPLLVLLHSRLETLDDYIVARQAKSRELVEILTTELGNDIVIPGTAALEHWFWLFPIQITTTASFSQSRLVTQLIQEGFDVTSGATQLTWVPSRQSGVPDPEQAKALMNGLVYLPVTPEMPRWAMQKMVQKLKMTLQQSSCRL